MREIGETGKRVCRTAVIGTVKKYPTRDLAESAVNGLRMQVNEDSLRQQEQRILIGDLVITTFRPNSAKRVPGILMQLGLCTGNS
jgi:hypothetical protein